MARKRRRQRSRIQAPAVLILCQGKVTEPTYFHAIRQSARARGVTIRNKSKDPIKLVDYAKTLAKREGFDRIFIVVDQDDTPAQDLQTAARNASRLSTKDQKLDLIISHVCFETWLVAHIRELPTAGMDRQQLANTLKQTGFVTGNENKTLSDSFPYSQWQQAADRVENIDPNTVGSNPSTAVPHVVRQIISQEY